MTDTRMLFLAAVIPVTVLLVYVFRKDRADKEPLGLLALLFFAGMMGTIPAGFLENLLLSPMESFFEVIMWRTESEVVYDCLYYVYTVLSMTFVVGAAEEGVKLFMLWRFTHNNRNFNSLFDGIVYSVFVSLGFAAFENLQYVFYAASGSSFLGGVETAIARSFTAIPGHTAFAVVMGILYSEVKRLQVEEGISVSYKGCMIIPMLIHGLYDTCAVLMEDSNFFVTCFYLQLMVLYIVSLRIIKKASVRDRFFRHPASEEENKEGL